MANVQLFAKQQHTGQFVALDLHVAEPIKLDLSVANINQPTDTNSVFSRTFKVPHTSVNGPYFEGVFNVNSLNFDASIKADAYILDNGIFFENGNIRLNAIYTNSEDNSVQYEITFYGSTSDFGSKIGGGFLNEVDLNMYNHNKDYANITASWTTPGIFNGDVVYGLIEWGYAYNDKNQPSIPTLSANFTPATGSAAGTPAPSGSFTHAATKYKLTQWKPQIRAKALWDRIFEESGYTYDSAFLDSDFFKKQYIISDNQSRAELDNANTFEAQKQGGYSNVLAASFPWVTPTEVSDPGSNFAPNQFTSGKYTAPASGQYSFEMSAEDWSVSPSGGGGGAPATYTFGWEAKIIDDVTGLTVGLDVDQITFDDFNQYFDTFLATFTINLTAGQRVRFEFRTWNISGDGFSGSTQIYYYNQRVACTLAPNIMSFNAIMPSNIRKIDFMKSIINRYRLVFVPSKFQQNHFTITPWKDWILEGRSKDWTDKFDASKDMVIKPLFFDQARFQIYKDQEDSDFLNYNYQLTLKQTFGQLNLDSTNELIKGTKEYKDQFAPTPVAGIGWRAGTGTAPNNWTSEQAAAFIIPHIAKDTGGQGDVDGNVAVGKREPIQPKLRLVFYNGLRATPGNLPWFMEDTTSGTSLSSIKFQYPLMTQYSEYPVTSTTFDLNWENDVPLWDVAELGRAQTPFSCFNTFWKTWYDVTFDPYSRLVEAHFVLDYADILDLQFNDYIFVKDAWYFVNSVSGYIAGKRSNCKVQLVKLGNNIGVTLPVITPPSYAATPVCYHPSNKCASHCCSQFEGAEQTVIYIDGLTLVTSQTAYNETVGGIFAAPGYYTDASGTVLMSGSGVLSVQTTGECNCTPVYYSFTVHFNGESPCEVCCNNGPLVTIYGANSVFEQNNSFYTNSLLTSPAPFGYYKESGGTVAVEVGVTGNVLSYFNCATCECTVYYPFTVCRANDLCTACCCEGKGGATTVWGEEPVFSNNLELYTSNSGTTTVTDGYYKFNSTNVAIVTGGAGVISAFGVCSSCGPCTFDPIEFPVDVTVNVSVAQQGYTSSVLLQKSYDSGLTFIDVGSLTVSPEDTNLNKSANFVVELEVVLRAINTSTVVGGNMEANYYVGLDEINSLTAITPNSITLQTAPIMDASAVYEFNNIVTAGQVGTEDNLLVSGSFVEYQGDTNHKGAIALTPTAAVNAGIDFTTGFTNSGGLATCSSIIKIGNVIVVSGIFNEYKGVACNANVIGLNLDGTINTTFTSNLPALTGTDYRLTYIDETQFALWPYGSAGGFQLAIIDNTGTLIIAVGSDYDYGFGPTGFNGGLDALQYYNGALYLSGQFGLFKSPTSAAYVSVTKLTKLTLALELGLGFDGGTGPNIAPQAIAVTANGIYVAANAFTPSYNGTSTPGKVYKVNLDGSLDTVFLANTGTGISDAQVADDIVADEDGIWIVGEFQQWNGVANRFNIIRLNLDGTYNSDFINNTPFDPSPVFGSNLMGCKLSNDNLYVYGDFDTYKSVQSDGLIKLSKFTGAVDATFAVGTGFATNPGSTNKALDVFIYLTAAPITTFSTATSYSEEGPCVAFCNTAYATTVYANATPLVNATILYADASGTTYPPAGYYATGNTIVQTDANGVIIAFVNPGSCVCYNLYPFEVDFDIDQCISCGTTGTGTPVTVYGTNPTWSLNSILYDDAAGTIFASQGYYTLAGSISLEVGNNGFVINTFDCLEVCPPLFIDCRGVSIINNSFDDIWITYEMCVTCGGPTQYGSQLLPYGQETDLGGGLFVYGSISAGGPVKIIWGGIC